MLKSISPSSGLLVGKTDSSIVGGICENISISEKYSSIISVILQYYRSIRENSPSACKHII